MVRQRQPIVRSIANTWNRHEDRFDHRLLLRLWPGNRPPLPFTRLARHRHHAHAARRPAASFDRLHVLPLDVTRPQSIAAAIDASGPIDVLVNNAGIGLFGALEVTPMATVREVFETNTFGTIAMTQALIPQFRARRSGVVVNVTSSATLTPYPMVAAYAASKHAIEGFTASLAFELAEFGVRAKLVEPGYGPDTRFTANSGSRMDGLIPTAYAPFAQRIFAAMAQPGSVTTAHDVAEGIWLAANDTSERLRFAAGPDAQALAS
jgi:NAD(P)-dependent dehydrogenase (short-subunit alcohol dehydrogenase family)